MLPLIHLDAEIAAIHKPSGLLVHRSELDRHETRFAVQLLRDQLGRHVYPAHRLDRGTSGLLLFALDKDSLKHLAGQFQRQEVDKTYLAVVRGHPPAAGHIDHALSRHRDDAEWRRSAELDDEPAQAAVTDYRVLATCELPFEVDRYPTSRYALVELSPQTGRRHQLRRHMKHLAHPIIGDATFGKGRHNRFFQAQFDCRRMLLACVRMRLVHPGDGSPLDLIAPPDGEFAALLQALGWTAALPEWLQATAPPA